MIFLKTSKKVNTSTKILVLLCYYSQRSQIRSRQFSQVFRTISISEPQDLWALTVYVLFYFEVHEVILAGNRRVFGISGKYDENDVHNRFSYISVFPFVSLKKHWICSKYHFLLISVLPTINLSLALFCENFIPNVLRLFNVKPYKYFFVCVSRRLFEYFMHFHSPEIVSFYLKKKRLVN